MYSISKRALVGGMAQQIFRWVSAAPPLVLDFFSNLKNLDAKPNARRSEFCVPHFDTPKAAYTHVSCYRVRHVRLPRHAIHVAHPGASLPRVHAYQTCQKAHTHTYTRARQSCTTSRTTTPCTLAGNGGCVLFVATEKKLRRSSSSELCPEMRCRAGINTRAGLVGDCHGGTDAQQEEATGAKSAACTRRSRLLRRYVFVSGSSLKTRQKGQKSPVMGVGTHGKKMLQ